VTRAPAVLLLMAATAGCATWTASSAGSALLARADHQAREGAWEDAVATYDQYLARYPDSPSSSRALQSRDTLAEMLVARNELTRLRAEVRQLRAELAQARDDLTRREGDLVRTRQELATRQAEADRLRADLERLKQIDLRLERRRP
jgi:hypothetical protein